MPGLGEYQPQIALRQHPPSPHHLAAAFPVTSAQTAAWSEMLAPSAPRAPCRPSSFEVRLGVIRIAKHIDFSLFL
jgi:hypothetical protein